MTSLKQIEANRRNALKSTGPRTEDGKQSASRNAIRHGLTAETVLEPLEDPEDYKAFEQAITADYEARNRRRTGIDPPARQPAVAAAAEQPLLKPVC